MTGPQKGHSPGARILVWGGEAKQPASRATSYAQFEPVTTQLPDGFEALRAEAQAEGYNHVDRFAAEWIAGTTRFDRPGEALLAGRVEGELAAIGGLTIDPYRPDALRMRRFYVRKSFRRNGIGRALAGHLLARARPLHRPVIVNAAAGSEQFWNALGFRGEGVASA